jgi:hypothetical protein
VQRIRVKADHKVCRGNGRPGWQAFKRQAVHEGDAVVVVVLRGAVHGCDAVEVDGGQ